MNVVASPFWRRRLVGEEEEAAVSSAEENKALVRRFLEAHAKGDLNTLEEMLAPDFVDHNLIPGQQPGREGYLRAFTEYHAAYSDTRYVIEKQVAEGDEVVTTFTVSASHDRGEWMGLMPTGKKFEALLILVHRIAGGKITDEWAQGSGLAELTQRRLEQEMRKRERIEQELRVARGIQQAALPQEVPTLEGWQIAPYYQPAREVGGDFYDFFELEEDRVGVVVGDATGKGVPAALVVTATCSMLRAVAQSLGYSSPGEVLARVNETLLARIPPNTFVTCFYAILEPESGRLLYANAGHNLPCCRDKHAATELKARGMPLGLMPEMSYEEKESVLEAGEGVLFYTDGLVEAHNPQGEMFGTPRLLDLLSKRSEGGRDLSATLMEDLERFTGEGWEQEDDITLLMLERSATRS
jgi:serine phosphatase RsbU (regulator of sigma subunit)/predicted ester cyclase